MSFLDIHHYQLVFDSSHISFRSWGGKRLVNMIGWNGWTCCSSVLFFKVKMMHQWNHSRLWRLFFCLFFSEPSDSKYCSNWPHLFSFPQDSPSLKLKYSWCWRAYTLQTLGKTLKREAELASKALLRALTNTSHWVWLHIHICVYSPSYIFIIISAWLCMCVPLYTDVCVSSKH